jgi:phage shock protein A
MKFDLENETDGAHFYLQTNVMRIMENLTYLSGGFSVLTDKLENKTISIDEFLKELKETWEDADENLAKLYSAFWFIRGDMACEQCEMEAESGVNKAGLN